MSRIEAIIFDCDGVLFDSHQANLAYYNRIFAHFDHPLVSDPGSDAAQICHTASSPVVLESLMGSQWVEDALTYAATIDYRDFVPLMVESDGLKPSLSRLAQIYPLAVATNRGSSMQDVLAHFELDHHFASVVTSRDVAEPKPAPDMLQLAARRLGAEVGACLFIGDSELDRRAAEAAKMPFIAYGDQVEAERRVSTHFELADLILRG